MIEATIKWRKGRQKVTVQQNVFACDCGEIMRMIGGAGCSHDSDYTYFYQCDSCKRVESSSRCIESYTNNTDSFIAAGYKRVK